MKSGFDYQSYNIGMRFKILKELSKDLLPKAKRTHQWLANELGVKRPTITAVLNGSRNPVLKKKIETRLNRWVEELKLKSGGQDGI